VSAAMPNGKPGDNPYDDIVLHGFDFGSPEIKKLVIELHRLGDDDLQHLVCELVCLLIPNERTRFPDYQSQMLLKHLRTIRRLATAGR
jgi:hypothetical protein